MKRTPLIGAVQTTRFLTGCGSCAMATSLDPNQREIASWQNARRTGAKPKLIPLKERNNIFWNVEGYIVIVIRENTVNGKC